MHAVTDADTRYAGMDSPAVRIQSRAARRSGDSPLGLAPAARIGPAAFQEGTVLGAEPRRAIDANAVGELHAPAAPRHDALDERVAMIARMPRASIQQHRHLPVCAPRCNGCASSHWRRGDVDLPHSAAIDTENLSSVSRTRVEKNFGRSALAARGFGRRAPHSHGHNQS